MVEVGEDCLVHRVLIIVGRGSVHGVHNWVNPYLLKFLVWSIAGTDTAHFLHHKRDITSTAQNSKNGLANLFKDFS